MKLLKQWHLLCNILGGGRVFESHITYKCNIRFYILHGSGGVWAYNK
jgi:hypothetical protein